MEVQGEVVFEAFGEGDFMLFIETPSKLSSVEGQAAVDDNRIVVIVVAVRKRENLAVYRVAGNRVKE